MVAPPRRESAAARGWLAVGAGLGATCALAQVLLLRELLVGFRGNELSLGVSLAGWLVWVAAGSAVGARLARRLSEAAAGVISSAALLLLGLLPGFSIWFARDLRSILGVGWGEFIPISGLVYATALLVAPVGLVGGLAFPLICRAAEGRGGVTPGRTYLAESLGFLVGGVASFAAADLLAPFVTALGVAVVAGAFGVIAAWQGAAMRYVAAAWTAAAVVALAAGVPARLETASLANLYPDQVIVASTYSRYGSWAAILHSEQVSFYHNGALAFSAPDVMGAETLAHLALLQHPQPARALLVGGGVDGTAAEMLKYPDLALDYVELDPAVVALARDCARGAGARLDAFLRDPRLTFVQGDGRRLVKRAAQSEAYDVIIVHLPEPATALLNRFYSVEFFAEARRALGRRGVLCITLPSAENYVGPEMQALHGSVYHSLRQVFAEVVVTPGDHSLLLAADTRGQLSADAEVLAARWHGRAIPTRYFSEYLIEAILLPGRVEFIRQSCEAAPRHLNHDFRPVGYFYNVALAGLAEGVLPPGAIERVRALPVPLLLVVGVGLLAVPFALARRGERLRRSAIIGGVAVAGLAGMTLELCLLFAFQVLNGHVYSQVGALVALFMAGLAGGAWLEGRAADSHSANGGADLQSAADCRSAPPSRRAAGRGRAEVRFVAWLIGGATIMALTPLLLAALAAGGLPPFVTSAVVGGLMAAGGAMVGALFRLAVRMLGESAHGAGAIYAADLAGSAIGALAAAVIALPLLGLAGACFVAALMVAAAAVVSIVVLRVGS